ncbi:OmpA family protein [Cytophagales bacterium LB-30]|uniref:OmpA family protein n=1 Tax=Shiella aurantiaca TaxID=3058365 RepID=A0ABT8F4P7_9BACT|nr:OmpA family protein [Shiella aurantiaca]MDN4165380.1 OmpA family protein [Shiella aurantiaca]
MRYWLFFLLFFSERLLFSQSVSPQRIIGSAYHEFAPMESPDGETLFYSVAKHPTNVAGVKDEGDIWMVTKKDNAWGIPRPVSFPWNDRQRNQIVGFFNQGQSVLLLNEWIPEGSSYKVRQGLSVSHKVNANWTIPVSVSIDYFFNESSDYSMQLSADGKVLLMSLESYGRVGAEDLYVSFRKEDGNFSEPVHLGWDVNTKFQEMYPFLSADAKRLYFSSNGFPGMGSKDIFMSERLDDSWKKWSVPINQGFTINSEGSEWSYSEPEGKEYAYFVSTQNSEGFGDIWQMPKLPTDSADSLSIVPVLPLALTLPAEDSSQVASPPLMKSTYNFTAVVVSAEDKQMIALSSIRVSHTGDTLLQVINPANPISCELDKEKTYWLEVEAKGYFPLSKSVVFTGNNDSLYLKPLAVGTTVALKDVLFEKGSEVMIDISYKELEKVVKLMQANPTVEIALSGHTDNQGSAKLNLRLSQQRVDAVKAYLVKMGVDEGRISGKGYGGTKPIASNANEESRKQNRRVELTIVKN